MKLSQKDLEVVANAIVDQVYDENYSKNYKDKLAEIEWNKFKKDKRVKNLQKFFDENPYADSVNINKKFFE